MKKKQKHTIYLVYLGHMVNATMKTFHWNAWVKSKLMNSALWFLPWKFSNEIVVVFDRNMQVFKIIYLAMPWHTCYLGMPICNTIPCQSISYHAMEKPTENTFFAYFWNSISIQMRNINNNNDRCIQWNGHTFYFYDSLSHLLKFRWKNLSC